MTAISSHLQYGWALLRNGERGVWVLLLLFALLLPLANPRVTATDEVQYYVYLRSLRFDGDLNFANDYRRFHELNPNSGIDRSLLKEDRIREQTGLYGNIAPVGSAIMWAPFFLLADALVHLANLFGANIPADGFSAPYIYATCYASALYGMLGLVLCYRLARNYASGFAATLASIAILLATPLVFYMFIQMPFAHSTGFFLVALFLTIWHRTRSGEGRRTDDGGRTTEDGRRRTDDGGRRTKDEGWMAERENIPTPLRLYAPTPLRPVRSWRAWIALGIVGGLMTMTREQLGLLLLIPAVEAVRSYWQMLGETTDNHRPTTDHRPPTKNEVRALISAKRQTTQDARRKTQDERPPTTDNRFSVLSSRFSVLGSLFSRHVLFVVVFALSLTPQIAVYQTLNGVPRPAGEVSGKLNMCSPHMLDTLIDYDPRPSWVAVTFCNVTNEARQQPFAHGALLWSPILIPALIGLLLLWRQDPFLTAMLALAFVAQTYINGAFGTTWHLTASFGFRRLIECTPVFVVGLALLLDWLRPRVGQRILIICALAFIAWNAGLIANWTVLNTELRQGMVWPDLWRWQVEAPLQIITKARALLFDRCELLENPNC
jgi:hypothetical protein